MGDYCARSAAVQHWKTSLQKGMLPDLSHLDFPIDPFKANFAVRFHTIYRLISSVNTVEGPQDITALGKRHPFKSRRETTM